MTCPADRFGGAFLSFILLALTLAVPAHATMTALERQAFDLRRYVVTDPNASYFDVEARRMFLRETDDPMLRTIADRLALETGCRDKLALPIVDYNIQLPSFYAERREWRRMVQPIFAFEHAVSELAAAHVASEGRYYADCLIDFLLQWSEHRAFEDYDYGSNARQAWHQVEGAIFSSAMAYSIVRPQVHDRPEDLAQIETWLIRLSRRHVSFDGGNQSCCNNHLYRRGTYTAMVGVLTGDNRLFQFGVSAIYSALSDATEDGALPHEMERGRMAAHYQNFALIYLTMAAQIIEQQGYSIFDLEYRGSTLHKLIAFNTEIQEDPLNLGGHAPGDVQNLDWAEDDQYFAWTEIYLALFTNPRLEQLIEARRPLHNRSTGGYLTLYFYEPRSMPEVEPILTAAINNVTARVSPQIRPSDFKEQQSEFDIETIEAAAIDNVTISASPQLRPVD